jgi:hypothetical protein
MLLGRDDSQSRESGREIGAQRRLLLSLTPRLGFGSVRRGGDEITKSCIACVTSGSRATSFCDASSSAAEMARWSALRVSSAFYQAWTMGSSVWRA